jgi:ferric-dicitrate binding protein FerR (iron transport regulator)
MRKMKFNDNIPGDAENQWTAYLNGEPDLLDICEMDENEKQKLTEVWEAVGLNYSYTAADPEKGWNNLQAKIRKSDKPKKIKLFKSELFKYAATIVMIIGIGFATYQIVKPPKMVPEIPVRMVLAETNAHPVDVTRITLPDGSKVKLNAGTKIEYPEHFGAAMRIVKLSGEAFFEVTKDSVHPFRIETLNASVEVLGTSFNVAAYPNSDRVVVNVETGRVKLTPVAEVKSGNKFAILPAGQRGWLKINEGVIGQEKGLDPNYAAWVTKVITFQRTPLSDVINVLENTYHLKLRIENPELGRIPYTANFANLNPDYIIDVIARTHHLQVKKHGDEILLSGRTN